MKYFFVYCVGGILISSVLSRLQCRDDDGSPVDWYVVYKMPKLESSVAGGVEKGDVYFIMTSRMLSEGWSLSPNSILSKVTAPARTLAPYYNANQTELWLMYNDQPPANRGVSSNPFGHSKGVVGGDGGGGFWLVHSVPHFPPNSDTEYSYPLTGLHYGQSFLCVSLPTVQLNSLGSDILKYNTPLIYKFRVGCNLYDKYKDLIAAGRGAVVTQPPWFKTTTLSTLASTQLQVFAKAASFGRDLYEWVAKAFKTDVLTETWRNEKSKLPSSCDLDYKVMNIDSIELKGIRFKSSHDHSKWAISMRRDRPWVCVGDINRDGSQKVRGGGTVCIQNITLWQAYDNLTQTIESCNSL